MKKRIVLALCMAAVLAMAGCGASGTGSVAGDAAKGEEAASAGDTDAEEGDADTGGEEADSRSGDSAEAPAEAGGQADGPITFTMAFVDPDTSPYVQGGQKIADLVEEATEGRIRIEVQAAVQKGEGDLVGDALDGNLDIATCANSVLTNYIPQMNILDQAYLWKNADEAHAAVDGALGALIREKAEGLGLHVLGFEESGFRNTFSTRPIRSMEDFAGVKIRTMKNKYHEAAFASFGAEPVPMDYAEVFGALQDGRIDACENATANCLNSGYYEVTKNVTNTRHAFVYIILCMSDQAWNRIPEDLRQPVLDAVQEGVAWERDRLQEANEEATQKLRGLGVDFYDIDVERLQEAYRAEAADKGFAFDQAWQDAVDEAVRQAADGGATEAAADTER